MRWRTAVLSVVIGALGALTFGPAAQAAKAPADFYGVVPQTQIFGPDLQRMGQANVGVMRIIMNWGAIDATSAEGDNDWSGIDGIMREAAQNGVEVQPFIFGTPAWVAQSLDNRSCSGFDCGTFAPKSPEAIAAWQKFTSEAVARYGPGGTFFQENPTVPSVPITDWQAWNEMNSKSFFAPKPSTKQYAAMLKAFDAAVKSQNPSANTILGGIPELAGSRKAVPGDEYLAEFYDIKGISKSFDGVAIHPYGSTIKKVQSSTELFTDVIKQARDKKVGLWVTEIGAGSKDGGNALNKGKKGQATLLTDSYKYFAKVRKKYNVQAVDWFSWQDQTEAICAWCASSGLISTLGVAKPSLKAFVKLTGGVTG